MRHIKPLSHAKELDWGTTNGIASLEAIFAFVVEVLSIVFGAKGAESAR